MSLRWRKLGHVFAAAGQSAWLHSHAIVPIPRPLGGSLWRVHFSPRDRQNRSNFSWVDIDLYDPTRVLRHSTVPLLQPGPPGCFDDCGAMGAWIVETGSEERLYYQGWTLSRTVSFHAAIGLAVRPLGNPDLPFERVSAGPIIDRCLEEPHFVADPAVMADSTGGWRMWYQSGHAWSEVNGTLQPRYDIRHATSRDGLRWELTPRSVLTFAHPGEVAIARFCPIREADGGWRAFYSFRGDDWSYRIGTALSSDGLDWKRQDEAAGMALGEGGWERLSMSYPTVFEAEGARWMLYNSGRYGDAGFGIAVLEQD
ncbi:hypothetical protein [Belnapia sp. F-4-1]|uniref:hypothetical protein n=1 Tax=Belnapia sp. F-4-1 TaxID=1545443 RepID=UPI0005B84EC6|nr:hypothetical protein [Belnapia sp. F-4-1]